MLVIYVFFGSVNNSFASLRLQYMIMKEETNFFLQCLMNMKVSIRGFVL